jgi:multidrug efflux pump subunit AcrA (membrane-fusion protein)
MAAWSRRNAWWLVVAVGIGGVGIAVMLRQNIHAASPDQPLALPQKSSPATGVRVAVVNPGTGGLPRRATLPCSVHWHEVADLYARVSGYLEGQEVDIGSSVKQGQMLATVDVPELQQDVALAAATVQQALAEVKQTEARKKTSAAELRATEAAIVRRAIHGKASNTRLARSA